jgi:hypothetical protein
VILLGLNFAGLRRPAFSHLTWRRLIGRGRQVRRLTCQVLDQATQQIIRLTLIDPRYSGQLCPGAGLLAYGIYFRGQNEVRAWKLNLDSGQVITAPRLLPLVASLLLMPLLLGLVWLIIWAPRLITAFGGTGGN